MSFVRRLLADQRGHAAVEYGLICGLIVIGLVTALVGMGSSVSSSYNNTNSQMLVATSA